MGKEGLVSAGFAPLPGRSVFQSVEVDFRGPIIPAPFLPEVDYLSFLCRDDVLSCSAVLVRCFVHLDVCDGDRDCLAHFGRLDIRSGIVGDVDGDVDGNFL